MPKRSEKRDTAKAEYIAKKKKGEEVSLRALAGELGVSYQTLRNWKAADKWEEALPKKKRGGQPGNQNSKGKRNAAGSHDGAPPGNKNAEKDGAYSTVFFDMLSAEELKITESVPLGGREALEHEMKILKFREHKILAKIAAYESQPEDALFVSSLLDMRIPGGRGKDKKDGANQTMGMDNFYKLQQLTFLSYAMNGDAIVLLPTKEQTGQPYSLRVRLVEADRVCSPDGFDRLVPCTVQGHDVHCIVQGVETDADGMVIAYWVCDRHPLASNAYTSGGPHWTRVEAYTKTTGRRNVLHVMNRERAGQRRGVPMLAPVLEALKQLGRYTDAEITAAVLSAMFTVFVKQSVASDARPFGEMLPPDMLIDAQDQSSIELGPGAILSLNPGEDVQFADPKHPNTGYDAFTNALIRQIGAALEIPPEVLFKQFTTSYSAARGALNEFWRSCSMQRDWFTDDFCQPIYEEWFAEAVARGRIAAPGFFADPAIRKAYTACVWNGPARTNLNPVQEVDAAVKRVDAGFSTAQEETATMTGGDYSRNIRQRVIEAKRKREVDEITNPQAKPPGGQQEE